MSTTMKRRASRMATDDDIDATVSSNASEGSKRMCLRGGRGGRSRLDMEDDEEAQESVDDMSLAEDNGHDDPSPPRASGRASANAGSATEYEPGAIVRVSLKNFVTYSKAEFFPGPSLNMVIGPNGTGKSSLVCAICLGLGYNPSLLGRADKVGQFVKHGNDHAVVEVELQKRPKDRENYVIGLRIEAESNERTFSLNGKQCALKYIKSLMQVLRIQIDNLCQFLPQDKVVEFSGMEPIELLNKTLAAAAPEELVEQQRELKQMYGDQKAVQRSLDTSKEALRSLETRQQGLMADVERLKEREEIQKLVDNLTEARKIVYYNEQRARHNELREQKKKAEKKRNRLERENQPALEEVNAKIQYKDAVERVLQARTKHAQDAAADAEKYLQDVEKTKEEIQTLENQQKLEEESKEKRKTEIRDCRAKINQLEAQLKSGKAIEFHPAEWNHKIRENEGRLRELRTQEQDLDATREEIVQRGKRKSQEVKTIKQEIENLNSQEGLKLAQMRRQEPEVARAYDWLQQNQNKFEKEVFGPAFLTCSMKDQRYSSLVQSGLQRDDLFCFTAQTSSDHRKLTRQFFTEMKAMVAVRTILKDVSSFVPPLSPDAVKQLGLDGFAMEFVEGPGPVLAMLCSEKKLHLNGVALRDISEQQYQRLFDGEKISSFATGETYYRITRRREYGPGATSTMTKKIQPGRWWTDEPMDTSAKAEVEQRLKERQHELAEVKEEFAEHTAKMDKLQEEIKELEQVKTKLQEDKKTLQREHTKFQKIPNEIATWKKTLQRAREDLEAGAERMLTYAEQVDQVALKQAKLVLQHSRGLHVLRDANQAVLEAHISHIEAASDVDGLKDRSMGISQMLEQEAKKVEELEREVKRVKTEAQLAQFAVLEPLTGPDGIDEERKAILVDLAEGKTMESIMEDIDAEKARLELIHDADPGLLRDFEDRARKIAKAQADMAKGNAELGRLEQQIQEVKEKWEPALDDIIRRINDAFSHNFEQINCAGEVGVHKDEDFEKWSIDIKVKFRENESLQHLDKHRQSGGERSVSTIFYLMSLQAMAQAPFRVVDEINQGMDPRNERMVHERMVDIACHEHTSQYFLITPKLLGGLRYDERMKILCIASGEHMPTEGGKLDFGKLIKIKKRLMAAAGA